MYGKPVTLALGATSQISHKRTPYKRPKAQLISQFYMQLIFQFLTKVHLQQIDSLHLTVKSFGFDLVWWVYVPRYALFDLLACFGQFLCFSCELLAVPRIGVYWRQLFFFHICISSLLLFSCRSISCRVFVRRCWLIVDYCSRPRCGWYFMMADHVDLSEWALSTACLWHISRIPAPVSNCFFS